MVPHTYRLTFYCFQLHVATFLASMFGFLSNFAYFVQVIRQVPHDNWNKEVGICFIVDMDKRGDRKKGTAFTVFLCRFITVAVVTEYERSPHRSSGGCQPDADGHWHEWNWHFSPGQEERYFKPHKGEPSSCIILPPCDHLATLQVKFTKLFLNSVLQVKEIEGEFLALKLVSGPYAYSMEAVCPKRESHADNDTSLWQMHSKWEYLLYYSVKLLITYNY